MRLLVKLKLGDHVTSREIAMGLGEKLTVGNVVATWGLSSDCVRLPPRLSVPQAKRLE